MYAWNIPAAGGNNLMAWDSKKTTVGITIISTGHSGADCGLSYNSFEYLRLYVLTGDEYFLHIARLLEKIRNRLWIMMVRWGMLIEDCRRKP